MDKKEIVLMDRTEHNFTSDKGVTLTLLFGLFCNILGEGRGGGGGGGVVFVCLI